MVHSNLDITYRVLFETIYTRFKKREFHEINFPQIKLIEST